MTQQSRITTMDTRSLGSTIPKRVGPDNLFEVNEDCKKLSNEAAVAFYTIVAKTL
jgi:hypothetical protein